MSGTLKRLRRGGGSARFPKASFAIAATDSGIDFAAGYQPGQVYLALTRHTKEWASEAVSWEPSLKSPQCGLCLWHPPFTASIEISLPPKGSEKADKPISSESVPHKDVFVSAWAVPKKANKGKPKLLAKARIDLLEYRDATERTNVKLKLFPETKKVKKAYVNMKVVNATRSQAVAVDSATLDLLRPAAAEDRRGSIEDLLAGAGGRSDGISSMSKSLRSFEDDDDEDEHHVSSPASSLFPPRGGSSRKSVDVVSSSTNGSVSANSYRARSVENLLEKASMDADLSDSTSTPKQPTSLLLNLTTTTTTVKTTTVKSSSGTKTPTSPAVFGLAKTPDTPRSPMSAFAPVEPPKSPVPTLEEAFARTPEKEDREDEPKPALFAAGFSARKSSFGAGSGATATPEGALMMTPGRITGGISDRDSEILQWAKNVLRKKYPTVKVTNLTSSWRNGMAYCALIHHRHPELIDFRKLNGQHAEDNSRLAQKAAEVLGVTPPSTDQQLGSLNKEDNAAFLKDLKEALARRRKLSESELATWKTTLEGLERRKVRPDSSVISLPAAELFPVYGNGSALWPSEPFTPEKKKEDEPVQPSPIQFDGAGRSSSPRPVPVTEPKKLETPPPSSPAKTTNPTPSVEGTPTSSSSANRRRVQQMILNAHKSLSKEPSEEEEEESNNTAASPKASPTKTSASATTDDDEEEEVAAPSAAATDLSKIREELRALEVQTDHTDREKRRLETLLRDSSIDEPSAIESLILVQNERNSLLRRQMVLNLQEKGAVIAAEQERIRDELQELADVEPERKTEALRDREQALIEQHLRLVNERNELVLQLDSQEQAIREDEDIRATFQSGKISFARGEDSLRGVFNKFSDAFKNKKF